MSLLNITVDWKLTVWFIQNEFVNYCLFCKQALAASTIFKCVTCLWDFWLMLVSMHCHHAPCQQNHGNSFSIAFPAPYVFAHTPLVGIFLPRPNRCHMFAFCISVPLFSGVVPLSVPAKSKYMFYTKSTNKIILTSLESQIQHPLTLFFFLLLYVSILLNVNIYKHKSKSTIYKIIFIN